MAKCGSKCFAVPNSMKFPVCNKDCTTNCKRLTSASRRMHKYGYKNVEKRINDIRGNCPSPSRYERMVGKNLKMHKGGSSYVY